MLPTLLFPRCCLQAFQGEHKSSCSVDVDYPLFSPFRSGSSAAEAASPAELGHINTYIEVAYAVSLSVFVRCTATAQGESIFGYISTLIFFHQRRQHHIFIHLMSQKLQFALKLFGPPRTQCEWTHFMSKSGVSMSKPYIRLDKNDAAVLLIDHQAGLLSLVRDIDPDKFKNNVLALSDLAKYFGLPTILTTSFENGPNGPLVPELKEQFPDAPYIARPGNINAWDNEDFVKAVKATGKKQLIIAGVVTEVCVAFPALSAIEEGFDVFVVTDASGTFNAITRDAAWDRMSQAGVQLMSWFGVAAELHRDWRNDIEGLGALFSNHIPDYRNLMTSFNLVNTK